MYDVSTCNTEHLRTETFTTDLEPRRRRGSAGGAFANPSLSAAPGPGRGSRRGSSKPCAHLPRHSAPPRPALRGSKSSRRTRSASRRPWTPPTRSLSRSGNSSPPSGLVGSPATEILRRVPSRRRRARLRRSPFLDYKVKVKGKAKLSVYQTLEDSFSGVPKPILANTRTY